MAKVQRRSSGDLKWQGTKKEVFTRDPSCRLCKVLNMMEILVLKKNAGSMIRELDAAHYKPVGQYPEHCYDADNIVALNHYSHSMLDDFRDPLTGKHISVDEVETWWIRILKGNPEQYKRLIDKGIIEE